MIKSETYLRVPYDVCAVYISNNLRKSLRFHIVSQKKPDMIRISPLKTIGEFEIIEMKEANCEKKECIEGTVRYEGCVYSFKTRHHAYEAVMCMKNNKPPFDRVRIILPITTYLDNRESGGFDYIYIPEEFTEDTSIIPVEFVWEFLTQLPGFLKNKQSYDTGFLD